MAERTLRSLTVCLMSHHDLMCALCALRFFFLLLFLISELQVFLAPCRI